MNLSTLFSLFMCLAFVTGSALATQDISGQWYRAAEGWSYAGQSRLDVTTLEAVPGIVHSGGHFLHQADFVVTEPGRYVLDFKNTSIIGQFRHFVFDRNGRLVAQMEGGIQSPAENPFFLRHGRELELPPGQYRLISELSSPLYLAQPEPYLDSLDHYRQAIKPGNALALVGLGIFLGLGIYYTALSLARKRTAEGMYALFILGNLLFNGAALLVFPDLFGLRWIYLVSVPILLSNCAYIAFVMALLEIRRDNHPALYRAALAIFSVLGLFILAAALWPSWSLELARYGVGLFLVYGLTSGILRARQGSIPARLYLVAIGIFFMLGTAAISLSQLAGIYTLYVEHVGLLAVAVEVILLALVLAYQFGQVHQEREFALKNLERTDRIAKTDALTGLANRFALDLELVGLPKHGSLTYLDLDNLKYYNDHFGHERGDDLLRSFAQKLAALLGSRAKIYRVGGDEFAVACPDGNIEHIEQTIVDAIAHIQTSGFEFAGVSAGSAHVWESTGLAELKRIADLRMYDTKRKRKQSGSFRGA